MKRIILSLLLATALVSGVRAQLQSACQFSTCVPQRNFTNSDLLQIYGAILTSTSSAASATVITGTVAVTGTANVNVVNTPSVYVTSGNVGGWTTKHTLTITTDGLYANGDCVGGVLTATDVFRPSPAPSTGMLNDIEIYDADNQKAAFTIDIWQCSPTGTFTNNAPTVLNDASNYIGSVSVSSSDYITTGSVARACISGIRLAIKGCSGVTARYLYITLTTNGSTPNYTPGTTALTVKLGIFLD